MNRPPQLRAAALALLVVAALVGPAQSYAQGTLIWLPARRDTVFDHTGKYLYITTSDGFVQRFNLATNQLDAPYQVGGSLNGADIAADDSFLLVAQEQLVNGQGKFQKVNLTTGAVIDITYFPATDGEWGGYAVAIAANGIALVTTGRQPQTSGGNSFPLRAINLASNAISVRQDVPNGIGESTFFNRSFDGTLLYTGGLLTYHSATDSFTNTALSYSGSVSTTTSMNRDKTLYARSTTFYGGSIDATADLSFLQAFREISGGVVFDPTRDVLYAADSIDGLILGYDSKTFERLFQLAIGEYLGPNYSLGRFTSGQLTVSPDGKHLALVTPAGVRLFTIPSPPYPLLPKPDYGDPRGLVFDKTSHYLYATTTNGYVLGYNVATTSLERVYHPGGWVYGIDIAADDSYLLVAQSYFGIKQGAVQKIDLTTGAITNFNFDRGDSERGALDVHFAGNTRAFFSTIVDSANAAVGEIDLTTGAVTRRSDIPIPNAQRLMDGNFQIQRSADRSLLYFLDPTGSSGLTFTYHPGNDSFGPGGDINTYFDLTNAAVNRNGSLAALRYADTVELQAGPDFHTVHSFPDIFGGVAFNATQDVLYAVTVTTDEIIAYDTTTFAELSRMWVGEDLPGPLVGKLFGAGSLFASQDGRYLALLSPSTAISLFDLQNPPEPRPDFTITINASPSNGGTVGGAGIYHGAAGVSIGAWPNDGFAFVNWTENGAVISTSQLLDFQAFSDRTLVANFQALLPIAATPAISPGGGSFKKKVKLTAKCATAGARIVYTIDGSDPQNFSANWPKKGWKLTGKGSHTIKAKAILNGYIDSEIVTATFTIR